MALVSIRRKPNAYSAFFSACTGAPTTLVLGSVWRFAKRSSSGTADGAGCNRGPGPARRFRFPFRGRLERDRCPGVRSLTVAIRIETKAGQAYALDASIEAGVASRLMSHTHGLLLIYSLAFVLAA